MRASSRLPAALLLVALAVLAWSGVSPRDRSTWYMEVAPAVIALPILLATRRRFPLTPLLYVLLTVHAAVLCVGGRYTYAEVPLGFWVRDALGLARNHYDRLGHFAQGFVPAIVVREILLRRSPLTRGKWLFFLVSCVCLSASACYEFIEWAAALAGGSSAESFLGTQGDVWDTQWDMFMALVGAISSLLLLSRVHDRQLARLDTER
jgi:putative membrane protein